MPRFAQTATIPLNTWTRLTADSWLPEMDLFVMCSGTMAVALSESTPDAGTPYVTMGPQAASDNMFQVRNKPQCIWFKETASGTVIASIISRY